MARGTQHRKRRPRPNAQLAPATVRSGRPRRPSWEDQLFFGRLRGHARWVFVLIAAAFVVSFVILGVGSGSTGISSALSSLLSGSSASGASLSSLQKQTVAHPKSASAWRAYATKLEEAQQPDNAIAALTKYTQLRPKDQNALLELAGLYLSRANDWNNLYSNTESLTQSLSPSSPVIPKTSSSLAGALNALPSPFASAVSSQYGTDDDERIHEDHRVPERPRHGLSEAHRADPRRRRQPVLARSGGAGRQPAEGRDQGISGVPQAGSVRLARPNRALGDQGAQGPRRLATSTGGGGAQERPIDSRLPYRRPTAADDIRDLSTLDE